MTGQLVGSVVQSGKYGFSISFAFWTTALAFVLLVVVAALPRRSAST